MKRLSLAAIAVSAILSFTLPQCSAQQATTSLSGTITDSSGALMPGVDVSITDKSTGQVLTTKTDSRGLYQFQQLNPGTWAITAATAGFGDQTKTAELLVSSPARVDFQMSVHAVTENVDVSAETTTLNTSDATLGNAVNNATIQALPMEDRNVPDLLSLQPGVLYLGHNIDQNSDSRTGSVNGVRSDQGNVTMDGMDDNDQINGYAFTGVLRETLDSVEEFRVTTGLANSDQGRSSGAQINLVTKSGTNKFHGALYEYNRNTNTAANDWFNKNAQLSSGLPNVPGHYVRNTFGGDLGGPFKHDKLFFFGNFEASRIRENQQVERETPFASFKAGNLIYLSGGVPVTLTPTQVQAMDPLCFGNGTCPWGGGDDPYVLQVFNQLPTANGSALGDGLNLGSYSFSSPTPQNLNTTIVRLDWDPNQKHRLFVRGNLQDDTTSEVVQFPGQPPSHRIRDNTKGIAAGDTWNLNNNFVNDFRYGYIRQGYGDAGQDCGAYVIFLRAIAQPTSEACSTILHVPVNNFIDNATWTHQSHTFSFGINERIITNYQSSDLTSYGNAQLNNQWLNTGGAISGTGGSLDPDAFGYPTVDGGNQSTYDIAASTLAGLVPYIQGQYNFHVNPGGQTGTALLPGTFVTRNYLSHEFEYYLQDSWKPRPNLTITVGIRQSFLQAPYETHGQQLQPTIDTHQWFINRAVSANQGITNQPDLAFAPSGNANHAKPYWSMPWNNIAPRLAIAFAPDNKTSIRAGAGMFYDHFGQGIVDTFSTYGSFGITTSISNPAGQYSVDNTPRFTGITNVPPLQGVNIPSTVQYPYTPPNDINTGLAITWGIDDHIKTPYSIATDFSVQRELPHNFSVEADYIGTFGRHLLHQLDLAEPLDLRDPQSGEDYFYAGTQLAKATYAGLTTVPTDPYWEDLFPYLAVGGLSATQNIYTNIYQPQALSGNDSFALVQLDAYCQQSQGGLGCGPYIDANGNVTTRFYQRQFSSLFAWSSIGLSSYNALQLTLRRVTNAGLAFNVSYTYSNSIDWGSDTERASEFTTNSFSFITNSFNPGLARGLSDFDTRHLITGYFNDQLPFGRGKRFASNANRLTDALIGGWALSGITRWSSGLPFSIFPQYAYATNYQQQSLAVVTGKVKVRRHINSQGLPEVFDDPDSLNNGLANSYPVRYPYPGENGQRNPFRGDGYFEQDASLSKAWNIHESHTVRFAWEVFNATNSSRFDTSPVSSLGGLNNVVGGGLGFGVYSSQLVQSRKQQFSLRYDF